MAFFLIGDFYFQRLRVSEKVEGRTCIEGNLLNKVAIRKNLVL